MNFRHSGIYRDVYENIISAKSMPLAEPNRKNL